MPTHSTSASATQAETPAISRNSSATVTSKTKKKLIRRVKKDGSAVYRRSFQGTFLLLNLWIGAQFYSWVRHFELGLGPSRVLRPAGVEGWLLPAWALAAGIALMFLGVAGFAKATGHWNSHVPDVVYERLVPNADQAAHLMP